MSDTKFYVACDVSGAVAKLPYTINQALCIPSLEFYAVAVGTVFLIETSRILRKGTTGD